MNTNQNIARLPALLFQRVPFELNVAAPNLDVEILENQRVVVLTHWFSDRAAGGTYLQCRIILTLGKDGRSLFPEGADSSVRLYSSGYFQSARIFEEKPHLFTKLSIERAKRLREDDQVVIIGPWKLTGGRQICLVPIEVPKGLLVSSWRINVF